MIWLALPSVTWIRLFSVTVAVLRYPESSPRLRSEESPSAKNTLPSTSTATVSRSRMSLSVSTVSRATGYARGASALTSTVIKFELVPPNSFSIV